IVVAAASDENGYVEMEMSPHNAADNRVRVGTARPGDLGEDQWTTTRVAARTVDSIMDEHGVTAEEVGLVWIDVQGFEGHVLTGATKIVTSAIPVVLEWWPYGLRRSGGLDRLCQVIEDNYRGFVDVREAEDA